MKVGDNLFGVTFNSTIHLFVAVVQMQFFHTLSFSHCLLSRRNAIGIFTEVLTLPLDKMAIPKKTFPRRCKIKNVNKKLEKAEEQMVTSIQQQFLTCLPTISCKKMPELSLQYHRTK